MSFSFDPAKTQAGAAPGTTASTVAAPTGFSFGGGDANKPISTGFSLTTTQDKPGSLFGSTLTTPTQITTFGTPATTAAPTLGTLPATPNLSFNVGTTPSTGVGVTPTTMSTGFGTPSSIGSGFNLGGTNNKLTFGAAKPATTPAATGATTLSFASPASTASGFSLSGTTTAAPTFSLGTSLATTTSSSGFSLPATTTSAPSFGLTDSSFGSTPATTSTTGFSLGTTTTSSTGFNLGGTATTSSLGFTLGKPTTATSAASITTGAVQTSLGTATTVTSSASSGQAINFCQLEESINKWTLELEEQEKAFVNQATQINAWDKLLIANGEKIVTLNQEVERVKLEQQQLEQELDYVVGQQKELQDCLVPLEKELASVSGFDPEREYTYRLVENLDTQLKNMSEDLKEIIDHLNEANRAQDSSDPIVQIGKILNAHMNSLQWLDERTTQLSQKIQHIDQMHQNFRQENERSFNLAYN